MSLNEVLDIQHWVRGRWRVSSKRLLQDVSPTSVTIGQGYGP
jgi:hypothetical protein